MQDYQIIFFGGAVIGALIGTIITMVISHFTHKSELRRIDREAKADAYNQMWIAALNNLKGGRYE